ncbi:thioesterase II family protein [Streptomyces sp. NBC_01408]|uniref:thioesterase II family protein n=1 Tax=Streptomyces sp. NBC_01408 TaxID=2903855 RepID=UPI00224D2B6E|nr:alpha/beta fold hydrolase [Streptomyces sp. NBC_01408]MCX4693286.1 thioesterase domain-containing protein [Streptomyces sp. NBC_01408]
MTTGLDSNRWFRRYPATAAPRRRLVVLPHAGGSASFYHAWGRAFDGETEVLVAAYPGRQERFAEPCIDRMDVLADEVTAALLPLAGIPLTLFGHSMGASLAYEVALRLEARHAVRPAAVHVSSRRAPHRLTQRNLYLAGDAALLDEVRMLGGTATALLDDPDVQELVLPALRADFTIVGTYGPRSAVPLGCPVHAWIGDADPNTPVREMEAWGDVAPRGFQLRVLPGGHFYLVEQHDALVRGIAEQLVPVG